MLVTKSKYDSALRNAAEWRACYEHALRKYTSLLGEWNDLVRKVNRGEYVLASSKPAATFTPDELDTLVRLCHPDKHGGSKAANDMTARLLALRKAG